MSWRGSAAGTESDTSPEPGTGCEWLSAGEAAGLAGISDSAIRKAIREGRLPAVQVGGRHRINREDLAHFKAARAA
ncbi:helix-turn-helix domain-containing protein [Nocardioides massiliensis]